MHADHGQRAVGDCLRTAVVCVLDRFKAVPQPVESLMMRTVDQNACAVERFQQTALRQKSGMVAIGKIRTFERTVDPVMRIASDMLADASSQSDIDDLHALIDAEDRPSRVQIARKRGELQKILRQTKIAGAAVFLTVKRGIAVPLSGQEQSVANG